MHVIQIQRHQERLSVHRDVYRIVEGTPKPDYLPGGTDASDSVIGMITQDAKRRTATAAAEMQPADAHTRALLSRVDRDLLMTGCERYARDAERLLERWASELARLMSRCAPGYHCVLLCTPDSSPIDPWVVLILGVGLYHDAPFYAFSRHCA